MTTVSRSAFDPGLCKAAADRVSADTEFRANIGIGSARAVLGNDVVNVHALVGASERWWWRRTLGGVAAAMFRLCHKRQVVDGVIERVTIVVMDDLPSHQCATKMARHDYTMFISQPTTIPNHSIATAFAYVATLPSRVLGAGTSWHANNITCRRYIAALRGG